MYRIIIVEDEKILRKGLVLTTPWHEYSCQVIAEASNGQEGLELILKLQPDIVITDIKMPIMSGIKMLEEVRKVYDPAIIIVTAFSDFEYAKKAIDFRVIDYLVKPFSDQQLKEAMLKATHKVNERSNYSENKELEQLHFRLSQSDKSKHANIINALDFIKNNFQNNITINDIATAIDVSESYLSHLFKEETDFTIVEYLTMVRVSKACQYLKDPSIRINVVAELVGYQDQRYFSQVFKKLLSITPKQYQENRK